MDTPVEIELKTRVDSHEPVRAALLSAGATKVGIVSETNHLFDTPDGSLLNRGAGLRVREHVVIEGPPQPASVTFKGCRRPGPFKTRGEIEFTVDDAASARDFITALGFIETMRFQKRRERWMLGECAVELDELPRLGRFVEIEGPSDDAIRAAAIRLGLDPSASIHQGYPALLAAMAAPDAPRPLAFAFE